ncbi:MAG: YifB family Mg chelatase-like AAA ATPase [Candidatus Gracilibacteria bacterium]
MASKIFSCFVDGMEARKIEVEVDILHGLPGLSIVGLGDTAVQEAKERIRSAIKNSGATYPQQKKIINLAPAHLRKNGACFDVPMAIGLLEASGQIRVSPETIFVGELALNGDIRPVKGALSIAMFAQKHGKKLFLPRANAEEISILNPDNVHPVDTLLDIIEHCTSGRQVPAWMKKDVPTEETVAPLPEVDVCMIQGQVTAKQAIKIAAAGGHHLLMYGPPGTGKTLLAQAMQGILPPLNTQEKLEVMQIYSVAGLLQGHEDKFHFPPLRKIHQTCTLPALLGGGQSAQPGEISLAHHGILFFDEIAEAPRRLLESLRQPLEERKITVNRLHHHVEYPAGFTLIAAMNPCPCGYYGSKEKPCICGNSAIVLYHKKISGPIMDRLGMFIRLQREPVKVTSEPEPVTSAMMYRDIKNARQRQRERFQHPTMLNADITVNNMRKYCILDPEAEKIIDEAAEKHKLSNRSLHNILKVARTAADLNGHENITVDDANEALVFRIQPTSPLI